MTKLIIGVVLAVVVGGGVYFASKKSDQTNEAANVSSSEEQSDAPASFTGTISELLGLGQNITCTFSRMDENGTVNGTVYLAASGERIRGDFQMTSSQGEMGGSLIRRDGTNYTWGDTPYGAFAIKVAVEDEMSDGMSDKDTQGVDFDENMDYTCSPWRVDEGKFELPSGVEFQDISAKMEAVNASVGATRDAQCGACDSIPDAAAKAQCKAALGCQ